MSNVREKAILEFFDSEDELTEGIQRATKKILWKTDYVYRTLPGFTDFDFNSFSITADLPDHVVEKIKSQGYTEKSIGNPGISSILKRSVELVEPFFKRETTRYYSPDNFDGRSSIAITQREYTGTIIFPKLLGHKVVNLTPSLDNCIGISARWGKEDERSSWTYTLLPNHNLVRLDAYPESATLPYEVSRDDHIEALAQLLDIVLETT